MYHINCGEAKHLEAILWAKQSKLEDCLFSLIVFFKAAHSRKSLLSPRTTQGIFMAN